jgi:hypothetical protein
MWMTNDMPASLVTAVAHVKGVAASVAVANGTVWLPDRTGPPGMAYPIDVSAAPPRRFAAADPAAATVASLRPGQVILSAGSARLRHMHVGSRVRFGSASLRVAGVVPDAVIGDAEMFVTAADGRRLGLPGNRYLLVRPARSSAWPAISAAIRRRVPAATPLRLERPGRAHWLREGDAVLPPLLEKLRFGEFAADPHPRAGGWLTIDPSWRTRHLLSARVPILGTVTCNRAFFPQLRAALRTVVDDHLQHAIQPNDYGGCWAPRIIPNIPGSSVSHHAYGSAIDINVSSNEEGSRPQQNRRLVRIFAAHGLTWGGRWLTPDGMHFESLRPR